MGWKRIAFWLILFYLVYTWPLLGKDRNDPVRLWVSSETNVCLWKPCYLHAIVFATPNEANRWVSLAWISDESESGSSFKQLEGENSSLVVIDQFVRVGEGTYVLEACIYRPKRHCDRKTILSGGGGQ